MAYWGLAMANVNNEERARQFVAQAGEMADDEDRSVSEREIAWIDALAAYYDKDVSSKKKRAQKFVDALEELVLDYPDDIEAKAFLACQVWMNKNAGISITSHAGINALLDDVFEVDSMHPAHHYRIHLWDYKRPKQALESAARGGPSLPAVAHMWHMPGHIYSRLKRYEDAVWQQEASARVDHRHMMRDQVLPDQIHNFAHNNEWCIRNLNHIGRVRDAVDLAKNMISMPRHPEYNSLNDRGSARYGRERLLQTLSRYELWGELIALCENGVLEPTEDTSEQIRRLRYFGRACYRSGRTARGDSVLNELKQRRVGLQKRRDQRVADEERKVRTRYAGLHQQADRLEAWLGEGRYDGFMNNLRKHLRRAARHEIAKAPNRGGKKLNGNINVANNAIHEMQGMQAVAAGDYRTAYKLLRKAGQVDALYRAWVRLKYDDPEQVLTAARKHVKNRKQEVQPLAQLTWLLLEAGEDEQAREVFQQLREISGSIDMQSPVFERLTEQSGRLDCNGDWRIPTQPADDLGQRPDLDSLGPFRWAPTPAPEWELTDSRGATVALKQFQDQPVLVIFYLGHGCLHCAEQLQEFVPMADEFRDAGIEMVAVSTDDRDGLFKSIENYGGSGMPVRLLADPEHTVFRQYRAFDEFENQPLHGTFLIDGQGLIRWQDISYQPFMDARFLLEEAQRLLTIEP